MSQEFVKELAIQQRKRLVASLMEHYEKKIVQHLPVNVRQQVTQEYRTKVMASVGAYHDLILDVLKASVTEDVVVNEEAIRLLRDIHTRVS